ncbi:Transcription factor TFIIIB component B'' [Hordeum vulgare]|uniref:SANT domain-containing protein n=2 Tax=Hordeum vulgare subsp. vulgare TaxID=112509 RepID=A0A8I6WRX8_HORVV|nr:uncharacterized protein LOC123443679 isoform X1 [Hordeum vulgare subsp. vulgare]XP_044976119.1 uncharacterized protein LOC123443679 isoform X1 [Hordeum vulgare subsp. vulgare]KAE8786032.1 Transcription factor TFIIIB component B'' [Hordeum vulgare]
MIDDEANFGDITDAPAEAEAAVKFHPKVRGKLQKKSVPSLSVVPNRTVETSDEKAVALSQDNSSQGLATNQEITSSTVLGSEMIGDVEACGGTLYTPSDDMLTVSSIDRVSRNDDPHDNPSEVDTHQENLVVSDTQASSTHPTSETVDDLADFGELFDTHSEEENVAKSKLKIKVKLSKAASKSRKTGQKKVASTVDVVSQNKEDGNDDLRGCNNEQVQAPRHEEHVQTSDSQPPLGTDDGIVDNFANHNLILEEPVPAETAAKLRPKSQRKPGRASSRAVGTSDDYAAANLKDTNASVDIGSQDGLISPHTDDTQPILGELSAEAAATFLLDLGKKKGKGKSVTFVLPDDYEWIAPTDTNHNDIGSDENLNTLLQQAPQKHCLTEEHSDDQEYTDRESQYHEGEPSDHGVEQQSKLDVGKLELSMKLRSRTEFQKVGVSENIVDDHLDEDFAEPSATEQNNDSGDENTAGGKQKAVRKSRKRDPNKEPLRGSRRTSTKSTLEKSQPTQQKNKSEVSSRGRKRALKDTMMEQPEKKLTHRIRQKRAKEVQTLLQKPDHEIDRMKLSVTHLRLLQEARERIQSKTPSGPSSSNQSSSHFGDTDDFDPFGDNYDNDRTENHALENATKLNYHSYMDKKTPAKWTKSDTDLFYQGLQQFGSDFAMIQQLFPDKSRDQVRQKFKSEDKKHPRQVDDAILHRSRDNLYLKQVMKQLNVEDSLKDVNITQKQEVASSEANTGKEVFPETNTYSVENCSTLSDEEMGTHQSEVKEGEDFSGNADDDDLDVFDWY